MARDMSTASAKPNPAKGGDRRSLGREAVENHQPKVLVSLVLALIVFLLGCIQLLSTVHTYVTNLNELNASKETEAKLIAQKADLENDIARWGDKAYVVAQARDRLGFVFPNEKPVRVLHPEAVTGTKSGQDSASSSKDGRTTIKNPWYEEMLYSFKEADEKPLDGKDSAGTSSGTSTNTQDGGTSQEPTDGQAGTGASTDAGQTAADDTGNTQDGQQDAGQTDEQTTGEETQQ